MLDTGRNRMFGKRRADGTFSEMDETRRSLAADQGRRARRATKSGYGDQGDRRTSSRGRKKK